MSNINDLQQATQAACTEFMNWHEAEHRLLSCVSGQRVKELNQEIARLRQTRRDAIANGQNSGKEYRQIITHLTTLESELVDLQIIAEELEQGALTRSLMGQQLWQQHLRQRQLLARDYLEGEIAQSQEEAREVLTPIIPQLARLVAREQARTKVASDLENLSQEHLPDMLFKEPQRESVLASVISLVTEQLTQAWRNTDPELDQETMSMIRYCPPSNLIRGDLVGTPAKRARNLRLQQMHKTASINRQTTATPDRDLWSADAMLTRSQHLREI